MKGLLKRTAAVLGAAALVAATAGCSSSGSTDNVLRVTLANHGWTDEITKHIGEFEKETGIKVELTTYGELQLVEQYNVKLNASDPNLDVFMFRAQGDTRLYQQNGWLADLTDQVNGATDWNWNDFAEGTRRVVTIEDKVWGVPLVTEQQVLYYRKDLLAAAGLSVPKTLDEFRTAAATLQQKNPGVYGYVSRGKQFSQTAPTLHTFGADWFNESGATLDTPEAISAYKFYGGMLKDYGPPGVTSMGWPEAIGIFAQGKAAFYTDANVLYPNLTDPAKSTVSDKVGFAVVPAGPKGAKPYNVVSWGLGVNEASEKKDNAWKFIQWATSKEMVLAEQKQGLLGARMSVWDNAESLSGIPAELAAATKESIKLDGGADRPAVINVTKAMEIYGKPVTAAITGGDVEAAAKAANEEFNALLEQEKRGR